MKKKNWQKFLASFECLLSQHPSNQKALYSLDSCKSYGRLLENPKTGASRDLFLSKVILRLALQ